MQSAREKFSINAVFLQKICCNILIILVICIFFLNSINEAAFDLQ